MKSGLARRTLLIVIAACVSFGAFTALTAAASGTRFVSKLNGYAIVLPGSTGRWWAHYAIVNWSSSWIPGFGSPELDQFTDRQTGRVYLIASQPSTSLQAWTHFVESGHPPVCTAARALPASTLAGTSARVFTWSCSDGYTVFILTAQHAHRGYMLLVASPTNLPLASDRSALDTARLSFKFLPSVG